MKILRSKFISASPKLQSLWEKFKTELQNTSSKYLKQPITIPYLYLEDLKGGAEEKNNALTHWYPLNCLPKNRQISCYPLESNYKIGFLIEEIG